MTSIARIRIPRVIWAIAWLGGLSASVGVISLPSVAYASELTSAPPLVSTSVTVKVGGKSVKKVIYCLNGIPGAAKPRGGQFLFTPFTERLRTLRKKTPQKKPQITLTTALNRAGRPVCKNLGPLPAPTPTAAPGGPTPTPVSTRTFDANGNVTQTGRVLLEIPADLSANVGRGKAVYQSYCIGCHEERTNRTYPDIDSNIRQSPMLYDDMQISRQQRADLVAYLNRFRL